MFYGQRKEIPCPLNSVMKASELLYQGYIKYWYYAIDTQPQEEEVEDILVVCEFRVIFLKSYQDYPVKEN